MSDAVPNPEPRGLRPEALFLVFGTLAAIPHLAVIYLVRNTVLPAIGLDVSEPKFFDNEAINIALGVGSLALSILFFTLACRLSGWRTLPPWRWLSAVALYLLPAAVLYLLPWIT